MYENTISHFADLARLKAAALRRSPVSFFVGAMMAGAYVGVGIILIFTVGAQVDPASQKLVMGVSFGIALTLVVFAGAELFTGHNMYMPLGWFRRTTGGVDLLYVWTMAWAGNLVGSAALALIFVAGGGGELLHAGAPLLNRVADYKMNSPFLDLFARGILCNWLVCLALWMSARVTNDTAKCIVIFWCLFAFIACGFEHSVANMTLLSIALLGNHPDTVNLVGMGHNLLWVTLGNIVGGSLFMAAAYWVASGHPAEAAQSATDP
jgi:nitrite transporter NirC